MLLAMWQMMQLAIKHNVACNVANDAICLTVARSLSFVSFVHVNVAGEFEVHFILSVGCRVFPTFMLQINGLNATEISVTYARDAVKNAKGTLRLYIKKASKRQVNTFV